MERGPGEPSPGWLKWFFIIGGSIFAISLITMGIIFAVIGDGDMYNYEDDYYDDHERDFYIDAMIYSEDDTLVIYNYGGYIDWDYYTVDVDGWEVDYYEYMYYGSDTVVFHCYQDIVPYVYYDVVIYDYWDDYVVWSSSIYSKSGYGA